MIYLLVSLDYEGSKNPIGYTESLKEMVDYLKVSRRGYFNGLEEGSNDWYVDTRGEDLRIEKVEKL